MPKLVLAHEGAIELSGVGPQTEFDTIGLSPRGHEQAMQVGHQLARVAGLEITVAFTAPTIASNQTALEILNFQPRKVTPMPFSRLAETSFGKINPQTLEAAAPRIKTVHSMIRRALAKSDVLVVAARSPYRQYVGMLERLTTEQMIALEVNYCQTRVYSMNKQNHSVGFPTIYKPH